MKYLYLFPALFLLSACVSQADADQKMAKACQSGVESLLEPNGKEIMEIKSINYADEEDEDGRHRRITISAMEKDGWLELEAEYSCLFMQEWGPFKNYHRAALLQLTMGDEIIGKKDGMIVGDVQSFLQLVTALDSQMKQ